MVKQLTSISFILCIVFFLSSCNTNTIPDACPEIYQPVCGVDNKTYSNECFARMDQVAIVSEGECPRDSRTYISKDPEQCTLLEFFCEEGKAPFFGDDGCGCEKQPSLIYTPLPPDTKPQACPDIHLPVCGSDNKTYRNECYAARAGVTIIASKQCGDIPENKGTENPDMCIEVYVPVCGEDGKTYSNDCFANIAGVGIAYEGECLQETPQSN